jgi:deoxycytidylate deaminase
MHDTFSIVNCHAEQNSIVNCHAEQNSIVNCHAEQSQAERSRQGSSLAYVLGRWYWLPT